ncbi:hypothetical protein AO501_25110 [Mycobacterium gordonae]|uniref:Uncharacterized protein n=1 Tax=Mycobacterium gordonae TaxID=1778 RepID=A0A0Q2U4B2_MYCGO|nr:MULTISPECIES: hypothetical protein [Mycobacterium]KQH75560.1 hypothetical protein AO501_25110 [Mycobacterium gordonae]MDP7732126.1 hypothetical protein [Mycobacterium sp. TY813]
MNDKLQTPTPEEVRTAADTVQALSVSMDMPHPDVHWRPSELRAEAERIEQDAREEAERQNQTASLGQALEIIYRPFTSAETPHFVLAKALIEDGWHKSDPA